MTVVRGLRHDDIETLIAFGRMLAYESPQYRQMTFSPGKTHSFLVKAADPEIKEKTGWVIEQDGRLVGFLLALAGEHMFFQDTGTWDATLFVIPPFRGKVTRGVMEVIRRYIDWAEQWPGPIQFGITTEIGMESTEKLLAKAGFKTTGKVMQYVRRRP